MAIGVGMVGGGFMARTYSLALSAVYGLAWPAAPEIRRVRLADVSRRLGESDIADMTLILPNRVVLDT